jgi:O-antigen ligase
MSDKKIPGGQTSYIINDNHAMKNKFSIVSFIGRPVDGCFLLGVVMTIAACFLGDQTNAILSTLVLLGFMPLILKPVYLIGPIFFMTVFDDYLVAFSDQSFSRMCTLMFMFGVLICMLSRRNSARHQSYVFSLIFMAMMGIVLSYHTLFSYTAFPISYVTNLALAFFMMNCVPSDNKKVCWQLCIYSIISVLYIVILLLCNGIGTLAEGQRISIATEVNPNQLAMGLVLVNVFLFCYFALGGFKYKLRYISLIGLSYVGLFLTGSRSGLIAAFLSTIILLVILQNGDKKKAKQVLTVAILVVAIFVLVYLFLQAKFPILMGRFTVENVISTGGTNRVAVWTAYFKYLFPSYWFFGIGFDPFNMYNAMQSINGIGHGAHNILVEILSKAGVFGLIVYSALFIGYFKTIFRNFKGNQAQLFSLGIILASIINGIGEDVITGRFIWFGVGLGFLLMNKGSNRVANPL